MPHLNVEIKARCANRERVWSALARRKATFHGTDEQTDTYFRATHGRLKLREGKIENALIHYHRPDQTGPKESKVTLYPIAGDRSALKEALTRALGVLTVVKKRREIYFVGNVKVHVDSVIGLGYFLEVEAIDVSGSIGVETLREQCEEFMAAFGVSPEDLIEVSYSDMLVEGDSGPQTHP